MNMGILLESLPSSVCAYFLVLSVCELGQRFSNALNEIDDSIIQMDWYLLPIKTQKLLPTTILHTQRNFAIKFYGSNSCSREQFKKASGAKKSRGKTNKH